jgi:death-on-curing protein
VLALHEEQLAEHGGAEGLRDSGLLDSALARPQNLLAYGSPNAVELAAAYAAGIARNHPFIDGNKRTSFVTAALFLGLNNYDLLAPLADCVKVWLSLADGKTDEAALAHWYNEYAKPTAD